MPENDWNPALYDQKHAFIFEYGRGLLSARGDARKSRRRGRVRLVFPSIDTYTALLEKHGLAVQSAILFDRPTKLEEGKHGLRNWLTMFCAGMLVDLADDMKQKVIEHVEASLRPACSRMETGSPTTAVCGL